MTFIQFTKCFSEPKQLIKLIVLVICVCFTISQLTECIRKMMHPPVSTYYKFNLNETIKYPSLTICRRPAYKTNLFEKYGMKSSTELDTVKAFINFPFNKYTIEEFLKETTYNYTDVFWTFGFSGLGQSTSLDITSHYVFNYGRCFTIVPKVESDIFSISGGYWFTFRHDVLKKVKDDYGISKSGFPIFLHDSNEILAGGSEGQADSFLEYLYIESAEDMRVTLKVQSYSQISTSDDPCVSDPDYSKSKCLEECIHKQIASEIGCTLPWLRVDVSEGVPQCSNYTDVKNLIIQINSKTKKKEYSTNCMCPISCKVSVYSTQIVNKRDIDKQLAPNSMVFIYYSSNIVTQMNEVISYDWNVFLSDIGGSLGFLLGLSVIGVIVVLEEILQIIISRCFKNKRQKGVEMVTENTDADGVGEENNKDNDKDKDKDNNGYKNIMNNMITDYFFEKNSLSNEENTNKDNNVKY